MYSKLALTSAFITLASALPQNQQHPEVGRMTVEGSPGRGEVLPEPTYDDKTIINCQKDPALAPKLTELNNAANYDWGDGTAVVRQPTPGGCTVQLADLHTIPDAYRISICSGPDAVVDASTSQKMLKNAYEKINSGEACGSPDYVGGTVPVENGLYMLIDRTDMVSPG
ncbi:MAG: hypothetical protein M1831_004274 [Alyxoria varia]|nr:MAG: hypothetical protein M1831_004274 [Alyxoria varia]